MSRLNTENGWRDKTQSLSGLHAQQSGLIDVCVQASKTPNNMCDTLPMAPTTRTLPGDDQHIPTTLPVADADERPIVKIASTPPDPRVSIRHIRPLLITLTLVACALRVWYAMVNPLLPQFSNADDGDYYQRALHFVITGQYIDEVGPISWVLRPPLHVWFFAACLKLALVFGRSVTFGVRIVQLTQAVLGAAMVPLAYALVTRLVRDRRAGLFFAFFWATWFPFIDLSTTLFSEPLYLFLFTLHLYLLLHYADSGRTMTLAGAGIVLGLAALTRSAALYGITFPLVWLFHRALHRSPGHVLTARIFVNPKQWLPRALRPSAILIATTALIVLPWTARNWITYHRFIPIDTVGSVNLWLNLDKQGERGAHIEALRRLPQRDRADYAAAQVRSILRQDPLQPFRPMWENFHSVVKAQFIEDFFVKRSSFGRSLRSVALLGLLGDGLWLLWTGAGLIGLLHPATDRPFKWVPTLWLLYSVATVLLFHVEPRYLLPIWLVLAMYGSWTLAHGWRAVSAVQRHYMRTSLIIGSVIAFLALFLTYRDYPATLVRGIRRERAFHAAEQAMNRNDYDTAQSKFKLALQIDPTYDDTRVALAGVMGAQHQAAAGAALLDPQASRQSELMQGALLRGAGKTDLAASLMEEGERLGNIDAQTWALHALRPEPRDSVILGTSLDLGYMRGFALGEQLAGRSFRWLEGSGEVILPLAAPLSEGNQVVIELAMPVPLPAPLTVSIDDGPAINLAAMPQWRSIALAIPPRSTGRTTLHVHLHAPTFIALQHDPQSGDPRALSVMVHRVAVER
ncbi:MAG: glycosyltransferase family 39 protein [Herpetosiphon sp.]